MNLSQFFLIIRAHHNIVKKTIIFIFFIVLVITALTPKSYVATTSVLLNNDKGVDVLTGMIVPGVLIPGYIPTQIDIITSLGVARMVVDDLKLADNPADFKKFIQADSKGWMPSFVVDLKDGIQNAFQDLVAVFSTKESASDASEKLDIKDQLAIFLGEKLDVIPAKDSSVLSISYKSSSPDLAAKLANAFARAYQQKNIQLKIDPSRQVAGYIERQAQTLRQNLEIAESKLMQYKQANGFTSDSSDADAESVRFNALTTQLVTLQAGTTEMNSWLRQKREAELQGSIAQQKERLLKLNSSRGQLSVLKHDVEDAQKALEGAVQALSQNSLKGSVSHSDVAILSLALVPQKPAPSKLFLKLILSIFIGVILGIGLALLLEGLDRKVRGRDDIENMFGVSVFVMSDRTGSYKDQLLQLFRSLKKKLLVKLERFKHAK